MVSLLSGIILPGNESLNMHFDCLRDNLHNRTSRLHFCHKHTEINVLIQPPLPVCTCTSFLIIPSPLWQGEIYILSPLDRETKDHYTLTAVARDNPGGSFNNRRENSVQVEIMITYVLDLFLDNKIWMTVNSLPNKRAACSPPAFSHNL